jgi:hypothetical protein
MPPTSLRLFLRKILQIWSKKWPSIIFLCKGYKKDIFERVLTGFELSAFMPTLIVQ